MAEQGSASYLPEQLLWRIHVFVYDLRNFRERASSMKRLDSSMDASYLGEPYFNPGQVALLKSYPLPTGTLEEVIKTTLNERLQRRIKNRVDTNEYPVCATHHLALILEKAFDINYKELAKNQRFIHLMDDHGLHASPDWDKVFVKLQCGPKTRPAKTG